MTKVEKQITWQQHGIGFGVFIYILNAFVIPFFSDQEISFQSVLILIPLCALVGFGFGRFKKWQMEKKSNN